MFKQCISIGCTVRTHFYYVPVLVYVHIPTVFQHLPAHTSTIFKQFLGVFQHFPCAHPCCTPALLACIPTMFKHFLWTLLLCHSTFLCAHPYCTPALSACIPTMFKHFLACISIFTCARSCRIPALPHAENYPKVVHYSCVSCISITVPLHFHYSSITFPLHFLHFFSSISFPLHFFSSTSCFQLPS